MAPARNDPLGRSGQRGDAATDPGRAGDRAVARVARAVAHPRRPRARGVGGGGRRLGTAGVPAPGPATLAGGARHRGPPRRSCPRHSRRASVAPRGGRLHRGGGRVLRLRPARPGARHQREAGAHAADARGGTPPPSPDDPRARRGRGVAARRPGTGGALERRRDGARRSRLHGHRSRLRDVPGRGRVCLAGRGTSGVRGHPTHSGVARHRPAVPRDRAHEREELLALWPDPDQAARALAGLVADGLAVAAGDLVRL